MADELTPGQVRTRRFDVVRKGYERGQVEQFLTELGSQIELLQDDLAVSTQAGVAIGIDEQEALARELHTIGGEVADILEAARAAAEGIRSRATKDADAWRTAAETESSGLVVEATEQTQSLRASAWNEGSSLLSSASAEAQSIVAAAKEEALFVRAEAEREAIRLTGDAKRDRDEMLRSARSEAEQIVDAARSESDGVLAAAGQQAELAQERARALEDRRSELLAELEATRASIGELETEIESRKLELEAPEESEIVVEDPGPGRTHHTSDGGSVKIVAPTRVAPMRPVDAEELVAEVAAMRAGEAAVRAEASPAEAVEPSLVTPTPEAVTPDPPSKSIDVQTPVADQTSADTVDDQTTEIDAIVVADIKVDEIPVLSQPDGDAVAETDQPDSVPAPEVQLPPAEAVEDTDEPVDDSASLSPAASAEPGRDALGSLFAQLRDTSTEQPDERQALKAANTASEPEERETATAETVEPVSPPPDPSATLIPLQNAALRSIKRMLVDLQNEALEHLRTDGDWMPDEVFTDRFDEAFAELTLAATGEADTSASSAFGTDLYDAVSSAMERSRDAGAGERELAAATSKVFRTWRSDEAERRVADVAAVDLGRS